MENMLLPIGTVVSLKGGNKKLMITSFWVSDEETDERYDYCGVLYPEGMLDSSMHYLFNIEDIVEVHYLGYFNEEEEEFKRVLYEEIRKSNKESSLDSNTDENIPLQNTNNEVKQPFIENPQNVNVNNQNFSINNPGFNINNQNQNINN